MLRNVKTFSKDQRVTKQHRQNLKLNLFPPKHKFLTSVPCHYQYTRLQIYYFIRCCLLALFFFKLLSLPSFGLSKYSLSSIFLCISLKVYMLYLHIVVKFIKKFIPYILCTILTLINKLYTSPWRHMILRTFWVSTYIHLSSIYLSTYLSISTHAHIYIQQFGGMHCILWHQFFKDVIHYVSCSI